jgi:hypothetical protein
MFEICEYGIEFRSALLKLGADGCSGVDIVPACLGSCPKPRG